MAARIDRLARSLSHLLPSLDEWLPVVRRLRPETPWSEVAEAVGAALPRGRRPFTTECLVRVVRLLAVAAALVAGRPGRRPRLRPCSIAPGRKAGRPGRFEA